MYNCRTIFSLFFIIFLPVFTLVAQEIDKISALEQAKKILKTTPIIDGHNDLPWVIRNYKQAPRDVVAFDLTKRCPGDTDIDRLQKGMVGAQFWSVWIPGEIKKQGYAKVQLEQIDLTKRMIDRYPADFSFALTADDIISANRTGKIACFLGMEGGHAIENSLGALRAFYDLGVRYMTLTHNVTLDWADAALDKARHNGLNTFGEEVVREMNRLGMIIDLSHVSDNVMMDVLRISEAPIIFSHSSTRHLTDHKRNVPDSVLQKLPENGGMIMITFIPEFISQEVAQWDRPLQKRLKGITDYNKRKEIKKKYMNEFPMPQSTLKHVADHIEYARKIAGIEHLGIGSDFYGGTEVPFGLEDTSKFPYLFAELIQRGWTENDLKKLAAQNFLRLFKQVEKIAKRLQSERPASTAVIEDFF